MEGETKISSPRDILSRPWLAFVLFWCPGIAIAATAGSGIGTGWRTVVWTAALIVMGAACIANAVRCRRTHCYVTGPFFLAMAIATVLYGFGVLPLGRHGWNFISLTILVGAIVLCCLPELYLGKYRKARGDNGKPC